MPEVNYIKDTVSPSKVFEGYTEGVHAADTSKAIWKISRTSIIGAQTKIEWAFNSKREVTFDQVWDNRDTLFPVAAFFNSKSVSFDGINDLVTLGNASLLNFERTDPISGFCWVKLDTIANSVDFFSKSDTTTQKGWHFNFQNTTNSIQFGERSSGSNLFIMRGDQAMVAGTWYHVGFTYDGSSSSLGVKLYINGAQIANTSTNNNLSVSITNSIIASAGSRGGLSSFFDGHIDEISIWTGELSAAEISEIYNGGVPRNPLDTTFFYKLIEAWRMGDGDISPTILGVKNILSGTLSNGAAIVEVAP